MHKKEDILPLKRLENSHKSASFVAVPGPPLAAMRPRLMNISTAI
jgi:hypothetical protein